MKKKIFAVVALALSFTGLYAASASTASAQECELVEVWLTINGVVAPTQLLCL
jgi:hypothetical protein